MLPHFRRPTSVFKRVQGEAKEMPNMYNYGDIDNLDHPYLAPGRTPQQYSA